MRVPKCIPYDAAKLLETTATNADILDLASPRKIRRRFAALNLTHLDVGSYGIYPFYKSSSSFVVRLNGEFILHLTIHDGFTGEELRKLPQDIRTQLLWIFGWIKEEAEKAEREQEKWKQRKIDSMWCKEDEL